MFAKSSKLSFFVQTFISPTGTRQDIEKNGEDAVLLLYKANQGESIIGLRKRLFFEKLAKAKSFVKPERLPPTCSSLRYHSFRTYDQILKWLGCDAIEPERWGWHKCKDKLLPRTTDIKPAPDSLLKTIGCNCTSDCSTLHCGCRKGLRGKCQINECTNVEIFLDESEIDIDSETNFD